MLSATLYCTKCLYQPAHHHFSFTTCCSCLSYFWMSLYDFYFFFSGFKHCRRKMWMYSNFILACFPPLTGSSSIGVLTWPFQLKLPLLVHCLSLLLCPFATALTTAVWLVWPHWFCSPFPPLLWLFAVYLSAFVSHALLCWGWCPDFLMYSIVFHQW